MHILILTSLLALQSSPPIQLTDLEGKPPAAVGDLVLSPREHREIVAVRKFVGWATPHTFSIELVEMPQRQRNICKRKVWKAEFRLPSPEWTEGAEVGLNNTNSVDQIGLVGNVPCEFADYAALEGDLSFDQGESALLRLRDFQANPNGIPFDCVDNTNGHLCSDVWFQLEFATIRLIGRSNDELVVRLSGAGKPEQIVVTFPLLSQQKIRIIGEGPPPPF